jgi:hypothetical protein
VNRDMANIGYRYREVVFQLIPLLCYAVSCSYWNSIFREWISKWIAAGIHGLYDAEKVRLPEKMS